MDRNTLTSLLNDQVIEVIFEKKDGTLRTMLATLNSEYLPESDGASSSAINPDIMTVWDVEESGWRSFRLDNLLEVEYDEHDVPVRWTRED